MNKIMHLDVTAKASEFSAERPGSFRHPGMNMTLVPRNAASARKLLGDAYPDGFQAFCPGTSNLLSKEGARSIVGRHLTVQVSREADGEIVIHWLYAPPQRTVDAEMITAWSLGEITPRQAQRLLSQCHGKVFATILRNPKTVARILGWRDDRRLDDLRERAHAFVKMSETYFILKAMGVSARDTVALCESLGPRALNVIARDPYSTAEILGSFPTADRIAHGFGMEHDHDERVRAGLLHAIGKCGEDGGTALSLDALKVRISIELEVSIGLINHVIERLSRDGEINVFTDTENRQWILDDGVNFVEQCIADNMLRLTRYKNPFNRVVVEFDQDKPLNAEQEEAVIKAQTQPLMALTGGAGVGKTTTLTAIIASWRAQGVALSDMVIAAPTARAAQRAQEVTGVPSQTIHSLLGAQLDGRLTKTKENPIKQKFVIVDEASMVGVSLLADLLEALPASARLVFVGDPQQLPPVSPGKPLLDIIQSGVIPVVHLKQVYRQAEGSPIVQNANRVLSKAMPDTSNADSRFLFIEKEDNRDILTALTTIVSRLGKGGRPTPDQVQILSPINDGEVGINALNRRFAAVFNPPAGKPSVRVFGVEFRPGDRIMITKNDKRKKLNNGDVGILKSIEKTHRGISAIAHINGVDVQIDRDSMRHIKHAFAITYHKSQGAEYDTCLIVVPNHAFGQTMNHLYTALTRAKQRVVFVGSKRALREMIQRSANDNRGTVLAQRLRGTLGTRLIDEGLETAAVGLTQSNERALAPPP